MYHPYLKQFSNEYLDLSLRDLNDVLVTVPVFHTPYGAPTLYVFEIIPAGADITNYSQIANRLINDYACDLDSGKAGRAAKLSGKDPSLGYSPSADATTRYPRPTPTVLVNAGQYSAAEQANVKLKKDVRIDLGVVHSALFNGGYIIHKGRVSPFKSAYQPHFPFFTVGKIVEQIPYNLAQPKKKEHSKPLHGFM